MDLNTLKIFGIIIGLLLAFDIPMLTLVNKQMYQDNLKNINKGDIEFNFKQILSAVLCYLIMGGGIYYFSVQENSTLNALILGLVVYGVYNTTNFATLNEFSVKVAVLDTLWGSTLFSLVAFIVITFFNRGNVQSDDN
jgi:uncharacterized membrane protein